MITGTNATLDTIYGPPLRTADHFALEHNPPGIVHHRTVAETRERPAPRRRIAVVRDRKADPRGAVPDEDVVGTEMIDRF